MTRPTIAQRVRLALIALRADKITDHGPSTRTVDEVTAGFVYQPLQGGKAHAVAQAHMDAHRKLGEMLTDAVRATPSTDLEYLDALVELVRAGVAPWQLRILADAAKMPRPPQQERPRNARRQALAEAAEFIRPASVYQAKPHKAAGDIARLQEWLAGQGVEVTG